MVTVNHNETFSSLHMNHNENVQLLARLLVCVYFPFLKSPFGFNETLWLCRHFSNVSHVSLVSDSSHSYLMWLHNPCQGDLGQWKRSVAGDERRLMQMFTVFTCWSNIKPGLQKHVTLMETFSHAHVYVPHIVHFLSHINCISLYFLGFCRVCVLTWSFNGADGEPDRSFTMGLQNIWRKGLQEGHNCVEGTRQESPCCWTSSHHIKPYPLFLSKHRL